MNKKLLKFLPLGLAPIAASAAVLTSCTTKISMTRTTDTESVIWYTTSSTQSKEIDFKLTGGKYYHKNALKVEIDKNSIKASPYSLLTNVNIQSWISWDSIQEGTFKVHFSGTRTEEFTTTSGSISFDYTVSYSDTLYTCPTGKYHFTFNIIQK